MELQLKRSDVLQVSGSSNRKTMRLFPRGKKGMQKLAIGDDSGVLQVVAIRGGEVAIVFKGLPAEEITALNMGLAEGQQDKIYLAQGHTLKGFTNKGKEFFRFNTNLTESIRHLCVNEVLIQASGDYVFNEFMDCKDANFFMASDRINDLISAPVIAANVSNPVLGCQDRCIRVLQGSDLYYEAAVDGAVLTLDHFRARFGEDAFNSSQRPCEVLYGTDAGSVGKLMLDEGSVRRGWLLANADKLGSVTSASASVDFTKDGLNDVVVGRDDGNVEVYSVGSGGALQRQFRHCVAESVSALAAGYVRASDKEDILVNTFSGKVISFTTDIGDGSGLPGSVSDERAANERKLAALRREVDELKRKVDAERASYAQISEDLIAVDSSAFRVNHKFMLNAADATYVLVLETQVPVFSVVVQSDVRVDLMDVDSTVAIIGRTPPDPENDNMTLATYRCQDSTNRVEINMRTAEGHYGLLQAFIIPRFAPKTCTTIQYRIKPLNLHQRVSAVPNESSLPFTVLKITGSFTVDEMHAWVGSTIPDVPPRPPTDEPGAACNYSFVSTLLKTALVCQYRAGEAVFKSDNVSSVAILRDAITKEATSRKVRVSMTYELHGDALRHMMAAIDPLMKYQLSLTQKVKMIEALQEIKIQEDDTSFLSPEYADTLANVGKIQKEFRQQPRQLDYLFNIVRNLYVDFNKFKGQTVRHKMPQLDAQLANYELEPLLSFMEHGE